MNARGEPLTLPSNERVELLIAERSDWHRRQRFTSNIAGPIFFLADLLCIVLSVPLALGAYRLVISDRMILPVHLFALCAAAGTYLIIRMSRQAYDRTLVNLFDPDADTLIDAVASVLIASALVWQFGMIENLSRGLTILYLISFCLLLAVFSAARPGIDPPIWPPAGRSSSGSPSMAPIRVRSRSSARCSTGSTFPTYGSSALPTTGRR